MKYDVVIPTNRTDETIAPLLWSLAQQTCQPHQVIVVADIAFGSEEAEQAYVSYIQTFGRGLSLEVVTHRQHDDFAPRQWASYVRNYGIAHATSDYVLCIDDDNMLAPEMMECLWTEYQRLELVHKQWCVVPTEHYRHTTQIRSQWYSGFDYRLGRVRPEKPVTHNTAKRIVFASSNCIFGPRRIMRAFPLREDIPFVYEDFERTHRITRARYPLYALTQVYTQHLMRTKTPLQDSYLHTPTAAYHKAKHRIMRVRSTATLWQRRQYFLCGIHLHTAALIYKILRHAPVRQWWWLLWWVIRGTRAGFTW